jgi:predicted HAD superfamily phosphohydrolase
LKRNAKRALEIVESIQKSVRNVVVMVREFGDEYALERLRAFQANPKTTRGRIKDKEHATEFLKKSKP